MSFKHIDIEVNYSRAKVWSSIKPATRVTLYKDSDGKAFTIDFHEPDSPTLHVWVTKEVYDSILNGLSNEPNKALGLTSEELAKHYNFSILKEACVLRLMDDVSGMSSSK